MKKFLIEVLVFVFCFIMESTVFADVIMPFPVVKYYKDSTSLKTVYICIGTAILLTLMAFVIIKLINKNNKK